MENSTLFGYLQQFGREMVAAPGDIIFDIDEPAHGAYLVKSGNVCLSLLNLKGVPLWSQAVGEGAILGMASTMGKTSQVFRAVAMERTEMAYISRERLVKLMRDNLGAGLKIIEFLSQEESGMKAVWSRLSEMRTLGQSFVH